MPEIADEVYPVPGLDPLAAPYLGTNILDYLRGDLLRLQTPKKLCCRRTIDFASSD
jgi:hypothetical protein